MLGVEDRKERGLGSGGRDPVFTGPPVGRGVNRQPDLDVSPLPEPARWLFIRPVLPPFISHYETQLLGIHRVETAQRPRPTGPIPLSPSGGTPGHTVFGMSQVRTGVTSFSK